MRNLSIKILSACLFACVCAVSILAQGAGNGRIAEQPKTDGKCVSSISEKINASKQERMATDWFNLDPIMWNSDYFSHYGVSLTNTESRNKKSAASLEKLYAERGDCQTDSILAFSDYTNSALLGVGAAYRFSRYADAHGCGTLSSPFAYYNRGIDFLNNKKDYICAAMDFDAAVGINGMMYGNAMSYIGLIDQNNRNGVSPEYNYPFYRRAIKGFRAAKGSGSSKETQSESSLYLGELYSILADEFYTDPIAKIVTFQLALQNFVKADPNLDSSKRVRILTGNFFASVELAKVLMSEIQKRKNDASQNDITATFTKLLNGLAENIYKRQQALSQSPDTATEIKESFAEFNTEYEKFKKQ